MAPEVAEALARLSCRESFSGEDDPVFAGIAGARLDGSALRRRYSAALTRGGLRRLRFHDLRHTFGTRMIATADIRRVQGGETPGLSQAPTALTVGGFVATSGEKKWPPVGRSDGRTRLPQSSDAGVRHAIGSVSQGDAWSCPDEMVDRGLAEGEQSRECGGRDERRLGDLAFALQEKPERDDRDDD